MKMEHGKSRWIKIWALIIPLVISQVRSLDVDILDEVFKDKNCIQGEIKLLNSNAVLVKSSSEDEINVNAPADNPKITIAKPQIHILTDLKDHIHQSKNSLNLLNELAQKNQITTDFLLIEEKGDPHDRTFVVRLTLGDETYTGEEKSIKKAKSDAAIKALQNTKYTKPSVKDEKKDTESLTPTVLLNNLAAKLGMTVEYINEKLEREIEHHTYDYASPNYYSLDSKSKSYIKKLNDSMKSKVRVPKVKDDDSPKSPFKIRLLVANEVFFGHGLTIQAARHDAATNALKYFETMSTEDAEKCMSGESDLCNKLSTKSPISLLYEMSQQQNLELNFDVTGESGPPHKKVFVTTCTFGTLQVEAEGTSKKLSKKNAAIKMLEKIKETEPLPLGSAINVKNNANKKSKKKKKKNKINRGYINVAQAKIADSVQDIYNYISGETDNTNGDDIQGDDNKKGDKGELLDLAKHIGFNVKFATYFSGSFYSSLVTLDTDPTYICYSKDTVSEIAENNAALNAIKFLKHVGLDNIIIPLNSNNGGKIVIDTVKLKTDQLETNVQS